MESVVNGFLFGNMKFTFVVPAITVGVTTDPLGRENNPCRMANFSIPPDWICDIARHSRTIYMVYHDDMQRSRNQIVSYPAFSCKEGLQIVELLSHVLVLIWLNRRKPGIVYQRVAL